MQSITAQLALMTQAANTLPPHLEFIVLISALQTPAFLLAVALPLWWHARSGRFRATFFTMWFGIIVWGVLFCAVLPLWLASAFHERRAFAYFPEMSGAVAVVFAGWMPSLLLCYTVSMLRRLRIHFRSRRSR